MIYDGQRIIKIKSNNRTRRYGDWYKDLVGEEFSVISYSIMEAEYTVEHNGIFYRLPDKDVEIVSDTSKVIMK